MLVNLCLILWIDVWALSVKCEKFIFNKEKRQTHSQETEKTLKTTLNSYKHSVTSFHSNKEPHILNSFYFHVTLETRLGSSPWWEHVGAHAANRADLASQDRSQLQSDQHQLAAYYCPHWEGFFNKVFREQRLHTTVRSTELHSCLVWNSGQFISPESSLRTSSQRRQRIIVGQTQETRDESPVHEPAHGTLSGGAQIKNGWFSAIVENPPHIFSRSSPKSDSLNHFELNVDDESTVYLLK